MISAIILAAGRSERMGEPKALLQFDTYKCLEVVLNVCRHAEVDEVIVVLGHDEKQVRQMIFFNGTRVVVNEDYDEGQLSSVKTGLQDISEETEAFLLFPVDCLLALPEDVDALINRSMEFDAVGKLIFLPSVNERRGHPVLMRSSLKKEIMELENGKSVRDVINAHEEEIEYLVRENPYLIKDMDTPEDYEEFLKEYKARQRFYKEPPDDSEEN